MGFQTSEGMEATNLDSVVGRCEICVDWEVELLGLGSVFEPHRLPAVVKDGDDLNNNATASLI